MDAKEFPPATTEFGDPNTPLLVRMEHPTKGGTPIHITVDKRLCAIRFEDETEERVTVVIEAVA